MTNTDTIKMLYDGYDCVADYDNSITPALLRYYITPGLDENLLVYDEETTDEEYFYLHDGLGTVRQILDASQNVENQYDYEGFGTSLSSTENIYNRFRYTGRAIDTETDSTNSDPLYYYRARMYDTTIGSFTSRDPIPYANLYPYCACNPTNASDPMGLTTKWFYDDDNWVIDPSETKTYKRYFGEAGKYHQWSDERNKIIGKYYWEIGNGMCEYGTILENKFSVSNGKYYGKYTKTRYRNDPYSITYSSVGDTIEVILKYAGGVIGEGLVQATNMKSLSELLGATGASAFVLGCVEAILCTVVAWGAWEAGDWINEHILLSVYSSDPGAKFKDKWSFDGIFFDAYTEVSTSYSWYRVGKKCCKDIEGNWWFKDFTKVESPEGLKPDDAEYGYHTKGQKSVVYNEPKDFGNKYQKWFWNLKEATLVK